MSRVFLLTVSVSWFLLEGGSCSPLGGVPRPGVGSGAGSLGTDGGVALLGSIGGFGCGCGSGGGVG